MNFENFSWAESDKLSRLALPRSETAVGQLSDTELDRPIVLAQEKRLELPQLDGQRRSSFEDMIPDKINDPHLAFMVNEMPDGFLSGETELDVRLRDTELDRPVVLTQETRKDLPPMSDETLKRLEKQGYPEKVLDEIGSEAEASIYENANLEPAVVNGNDALIRTDIDYDQKDAFGQTNLDRMKLGRAPLDAEGKPIELHHIGQKPDSPLAELTCSEHRGKGNDNVLHDKLKESEINREDFNKERQEYWKARAEQIENNK